MDEEIVREPEYQQVDTETIKCEGCGSNMVFNPDSQVLCCPHCGSEKAFGKVEFAKEKSLIDDMASEPDWSKDFVGVFGCENCGAKVVLKQGETATFCPFCGTSHVRATDELAGIKPHALIPFGFGVEKAVNYAKEWAKKRLFAPRKFKKNIKTDNVNGVYTPCFTFDSKTYSYYEGRIGDRRTRTVGSGKNRRTETYIVWRHISGTFEHRFDDVLITAGSKFGQKQLDNVSPFDTNNSKEYEEEYLLGFMAYHYDNGLEECWGDAKSKIDASLRTMILSGYVHDVVSYLNVSTSHSDVTYKYVMLPVYVGNYKYNKKTYNFYVNGSTGKVSGKTPISPWRVLIAVLLGALVVAGIFLLIANGG